MGNASDNGQTWHGLAEVLSTMPDSIRRLLDEHQPDEATGRCRACGRPGYGTPDRPWPCPVRKLAEQAAQIADRRKGQR